MAAPEADDPGEVLPEAEQDVQTVDAEGRPVSEGIDGVVVERCLLHADHRGALTEVIDPTRPFWSEPVVYSYSFTIRPGRIKGWGMHRRQDDRYYVATGNIRVVLFDGRVTSPTHGRYQQVPFTDATPGFVRIPAGVWHADQNWGECDAMIVNFPTRPYDRDDPDKYRIDPHTGAIAFDWSLPDG